MSENSKLFCYILKNNHQKDINKTYIGMTNNPQRRIRQHNQEIKGGAKYTKRYGEKTWNIYALISGFPDKVNALQCEWRIKHPDNKRRPSKKYNSVEGRIVGLNEIIRLDKWTNNSTINNQDMKLELWINKEFANIVTEENITNNITVNSIDNIDRSFLEIVSKTYQ